MTQTNPPRVPELLEIKPKILVVGVGGAGNNAVNNMIRSNLVGVEYLVCNTDAQHLAQSLVDPSRRIQLGLQATQGLGAGSKPEVGRIAAEESLMDIIPLIEGSNMLFITAGEGGGTGTGAAPVIARAAREKGILTVGVVTKPFNFEGEYRKKTADAGIRELEKYVDTLIVIPNQNLFRISNEKTTFSEAFNMADNVLYSGVRGVTDLMVMPGLINLDFADIRAVMSEMGKAMMGTGEAAGENRAIAAAEAAISNPLLDDISMKGAKGVLINITGGPDMKLFEVDEAANRIREEVDNLKNSEANIIFGSTFDPHMEGVIRVSVVATGIDADEVKRRMGQNPPAKSDNFEIFTRATTMVSPEGYVDPEAIAFAEGGSEGDIQVISAETLVAGGINHDDDAVNDDAGHKTNRKGFFARFMETLSGKEEDEGDFDLPAQPTKSVKVRDESQDDDDTNDMQDIPAYLRRKKAKGAR
jgi:cell division protein FtsZ